MKGNSFLFFILSTMMPKAGFPPLGVYGLEKIKEEKEKSS